MGVEFKPIGIAHTDVEKVPRHWSVSDIEGRLVIDEKYLPGLKDIAPGQEIVVIFHFHKSPRFSAEYFYQTPPHRDEPMGVFSICSPVRPNPIGLSILKVIEISGNIIHVKGIDMIDGTPILDIKPHVKGKDSCPSHER